MSKNDNSNNVAPIQWSIGATLLNEDGSESLGFAGSINGISNDALIVAGGANFPDKMPWEGGKKYYSDQIYVLEKIGNEYTWNNKVNKRLPKPIAYCGSTSTDYGIVYAGGENDEGLSDKVIILSWNESIKEVDIKDLPQLPLALVNVGLTQIKNVVYAIGGDGLKNSSNIFLRLDLNRGNLIWEQLPDLPIALANTVAVAQSSLDGMQVYAIGGRTKTNSGISTLHNTVFAFNPNTNKWKLCAPISNGVDIIKLAAGAGLAVGENNIILAGGDDGIVFNQIEGYLGKAAKADSEEERLDLINAKNQLIFNHQGFFKEVLIYDTFKDLWTRMGELPYLAQVTTTATKWNNNMVLSTGEIKPGLRTPNIIIGEIK